MIISQPTSITHTFKLSMFVLFDYRKVFYSYSVRDIALHVINIVPKKKHWKRFGAIDFIAFFTG